MRTTIAKLKHVWFVGLILTVLLIRCKKQERPQCAACNCINLKNNQFPGEYIDSTTIYQLLSGTWYLQQQNTADTVSDCKSSCYCSTQYSFIFLANKTLIRSLPNGVRDTVSYNFPDEPDTTGVVSTQGIFYIPSDSLILGIITYSSNYLDLSPPNTYYSYYNIYPQYEYILTRN